MSEVSMDFQQDIIERLTRLETKLDNGINDRIKRIEKKLDKYSFVRVVTVVAIIAGIIFGVVKL